METATLAVYLNHHYAGSVAALAWIDDLLASGSEQDPALGLGPLRTAIEADQQTLAGLIGRIDATTGSLPPASATVAERLSRPKPLPGGDLKTGPCGSLEALELLELGIEGKRLMWRLLQSVWDESHDAAGCNFAKLAEQAQQQRDEVERLRLGVAHRIFLPEGPREP